MATIRKRGDSWRAEICVHGRRDAMTFDTQAEAKAWAARVAIIELGKQNFYEDGFFTMFQSYIDQLTRVGLSGCP